jgi:hypothetical protein
MIFFHQCRITDVVCKPLILWMFCSLIHERLEGIIQSFHEGSVVDGRLSAGEDGGKGLVPVGRNVFLFLICPNIEQLGHIQIVRALVFFAEVLHVSGLEFDCVITILIQLFLLQPLLCIFLHFFCPRQLDLAQDDLQCPKGTLVKHGVSVGLILCPDVEQLVVPSSKKETSLVQVWGPKLVLVSQPEVIRQEWVAVEIPSAQDDDVDFR